MEKYRTGVQNVCDIETSLVTLKKKKETSIMTGNKEVSGSNRRIYIFLHSTQFQCGTLSQDSACRS